MADPNPLFDEHRRELVEQSAIDPAVVAERGYRTIGRPTANDDRPRQELKRLGIPSWATSEDHYFPGLYLPMYAPDGTRRAGQFKPKSPVPNRDGKRMKYATAKGMTSLDVHPRWSADRGTTDPTLVPWIKDPGRELWITEGTKKADALTSRDVCTVGLLGVFNWRSRHGTLGEWEDVALKGRDVTICFDADALEKTQVLGAMKRLGNWLRSKGVAKVWYLVTPGAVNGTPCKGVDDYFAAGGTLEALRGYRLSSCPAPKSVEDAFTDSNLAELVAHEVLDGQFLNVINVGWHRWTGVVWQEVDDGQAVEAIREFFRDQYRQALDDESRAMACGQMPDADTTSQWHRMQSASRINAVLSLAKNITTVVAELSSFDTHHDLLNTPDGVLDLTTDEVGPHDHDLRMTKVTAVPYVPGATSNDFKTALEAVPPDAWDWLQLRMGQAITGYEPDDDRLIVLQGGGENGKSVIMGAAYKALGTYAALIPNTLLLQGRNAGAATPEKMTLQGVRLGYMEETAEGRHLDTQALKEVVGTPLISGRKLFKDFVTFGSTHTLFLNTNHLPEVRDTDHGTWRRLVRMPFPYRFRKPGEPLETALDRPGDPGLKARMLKRRDNQEAILAWLIAGARRWYELGQNLQGVPLPESVDAATAEWRGRADPILNYLYEHMERDPDSWVLLTDLVDEIRETMQAEGQRPPAARVLAERIKGHSGMPRGVQVLERVRVSTLPPNHAPRPPKFAAFPVAAPVALPEQVRAVTGVCFRSSEQVVTGRDGSLQPPYTWGGFGEGSHDPSRPVTDPRNPSSEGRDASTPTFEDVRF